MTWTKDQADALSAVFEALDGSGVRWMVLRNYEGLPGSNRAKDTDLLFDRQDFPKARNVIADALRTRGYDRRAETKFQCIWCCTFFKTGAPSAQSIKIDLLDGFTWRGAGVVGFDSLYGRRVAYRGFFVPDPVHDGFMLWVKPLMTGGLVKVKYRPDILRALSEHPREFRSLTEAAFGGKAAEETWPFLEAGDLEGTVRHKKRLCRSAWVRAFLREPLKTARATAGHFSSEMLRRARRPPGSMLAVIGPDGSGKSTFIELFREQLIHCFAKERGDVSVLHFRPNIFPNIRKLLGGKSYDEAAEEFTSPHRATPAGRLSSFLRLCYYWLDYLLGYWMDIRGGCVAGKIYVFDRYFYDFIVDPYRSRIRLPKWLRLLFLKLVPEPDVVFFLDCDGATIFKRKQELPLAEIERQLQAYRALAGSRRHFFTLNASGTPEDLCRAALQQLIGNSFPRL